MLLGSGVGYALVVWFAFVQPFHRLHYAEQFSTPRDRWMLFFLMMGFLLSLGLVVWIPFHFEICIVAATLLAYNEAYGSHRIYVRYLVPLVDMVESALSPEKKDDGAHSLSRPPSPRRVPSPVDVTQEFSSVQTVSPSVPTQ